MEASTTAPEPAAPSFTITSQTHEQLYDPNNPSAGQWRVYFRTSHGVDDWVVVDDADYTAAHVGQVIAQRVAAIDSIHQLGGQPEAS